MFESPRRHHPFQDFARNARQGDQSCIPRTAKLRDAIPSPTSEVHLTQLKVLYVEDDPDIRELAQLSLQMDPGLDVRIAASGAEALEVLAGWRADVILLDVMMPHMDGPSVLAAIRADAEGPQPQAIFITARALPAEVERLKALGARGVITKPFDALRLADEVRRLAASV